MHTNIQEPLSDSEVIGLPKDETPKKTYGNILIFMGTVFLVQKNS